MKTTLEQLVRSWSLSPGLHELNPGASNSDLDRFEKESGWVLPYDWRALYRATNGAHLLQGNVIFLPLFGAELSVLQASSSHRSWGWPVPNELLIAGDNGCGDSFGPWHSSNASSPPIVSIGAIFEPGCLCVSGSSLLPFLRARTVYYLMLCEGPPAALDALDVPKHLRTTDPDDANWDEIVAWADPDRPKVPDDPYDAMFDAAGINDAIQRSALKTAEPRP